MMISIIAAVAKNGVIGKNNLMPWHLPQEMQLFRSLTEGAPVIVGRRTFESLPNLLENRFLIVLTRKNVSSVTSNVQFVSSIPDALEAASRISQDVFVAGGENVYQQFLPIVDRLCLSHLHDEYEGDAFFPRVSLKEWQPDTATHYDSFSFVTYNRAHATTSA